ncbi:hypothetical protein [Micromonospora sp. NBC_01412]|uniref:hypothetical protein n=1 Tax=Micromonospora sp. NBC_01412 TaxID=2903590 RepID=UPI00324D4E63
MTEPAQLAHAAAEFAARNSLTVIPAAPHHDAGPEVVIEPKALDLPGFLTLAAQLGGGMLYLETSRFNPDDEDDSGDDELPEHLLKRKGQACCVTVAFAANGLVHFWESDADWYQEWLAHEFVSSRSPAQRERDEPARPSDEERARLAGELVDKLLADPEFRAAKQRGERLRYAKAAIPADTHDWIR